MTHTARTLPKPKTDKFAQMVNGVLDLLLPPPELKTSEFADRYRMLSTEYSAEPGHWDTSRAEYQRGIMDAFDDPKIEKVVWMSCVQVGKSAVVENVLSKYIAYDPKPILLVRPTQGDGENYSKERLSSLIRDTPILREKIGEAKSRAAGNTLTHKKYPGGYLAIVGANSPMDLAGRPAPVVLLDERDRYPESAGAEGDPGDIAEKRTSNFWNRKIGVFSTPTDKGRSAIEKEFAQSDQRYYHVPCPDCGTPQVLSFDHLKYEVEESGGRKVVLEDSVHYACTSCGVLIPPMKKAWMVLNGKWVATHPTKKTAGFHINSLYSPWVDWATTIQEYLDTVDDPIRYKTWVNTRMGEPFEEKGESPGWENLYNKREHYPRGTVPSGGLLLVAAGDVQHDRIEVEIVAYGRDRVSWSVDYMVFPGDTSQPEVWKELDELLETEFIFEDGYTGKIKRFGIDSGDGNRTAFIYLWARKHGPKKVMALKGSSQRGALSIISPPRKQDIDYKGQVIKSGVYLWSVGTGIVKSEFYSYLRLERPEEGEPYPPGYCHFPDYPESVFKMFTAEERVPHRMPNGRTRFDWVCPRGVRNEALDCRVMARAVAESIGLSNWTGRHWERLESIFQAKRAARPAVAPTQAKQLPPRRQVQKHPYRPVGRPIT